MCVDVLLGQNELTEAIRVAMMINDRTLASSILAMSTSKLQQKQMALMLAAQQMFLQVEDEELAAIINNE